MWMMQSNSMENEERWENEKAYQLKKSDMGKIDIGSNFRKKFKGFFYLLWTGPGKNKNNPSNIIKSCCHVFQNC